MSAHVIPVGERAHHVTTMECRCRPVEQSAIEGDRIIWLVRHHPLITPPAAPTTTPLESAP